jgi:hypothetical protein
MRDDRDLRADNRAIEYLKEQPKLQIGHHTGADGYKARLNHLPQPLSTDTPPPTDIAVD